MKRLVFILVAVAATAILVPATASARHSLSHRVAALETKVSALQRKTDALHRFTHSCLARDWVPIGWYGDADNGNFGYLFDNDGGGPQAPFHASALDISASPAEVSFVVAAVDPGCLGQISARTASVRREVGMVSRLLKQPAS